jgi:fumarylacetoacetase
VRRPRGQFKLPDEDRPQFGPSRRLDYELELGIFIGTGNVQGDPIAIADAEAHLFGVALFNDWTARDIQAWEYQPLGPFLSKNFASTISPWMVTMEALAPFRVPFERAPGEPQPLAYLDDAGNRAHGAVDIALEAWICTEAMRSAGQPPQRLMQSNFRDSYWTMAQMVAHHTVNGCNLMPGDLFGSGTQSGRSPDQGGSMLELSVGGKQPIKLANGEARSFLEDGDCVILRAHCEREGFRRIGFGDCAGTIMPAIA